MSGLLTLPPLAIEELHVLFRGQLVSELLFLGRVGRLSFFLLRSESAD